MFSDVPKKRKIKVGNFRKTGLLKEERFFKLLSQNCNYSSPETTKDFYMGLVRHLTKELRKNGIVRLPHLGDFALVKKKDSLGWAGPRQVILKGKYLLRFYVNESWSGYFTKLSKTPGVEGNLDPREKILNIELE